MTTTWEECTLAEALVAPWPVTLGVHRTDAGKLVGHPVPWRLWLSVPSKPKAPPIVVTPRLALVLGSRCVAFTDVEASLMCAAVEAGAFDAERLIDLARQRQTEQAEQAESRVRPFRWLDACELAGVDPWAVARAAKLSLGRVLALLGCEAVRLEVLVRHCGDGDEVRRDGPARDLRARPAGRRARDALGLRAASPASHSSGLDRCGAPAWSGGVPVVQRGRGAPARRDA